MLDHVLNNREGRFDTDAVSVNAIACRNPGHPARETVALVLRAEDRQRRQET